MITKIILKWAGKGFLSWVPDETYLKVVYWARNNEKLSLEKPETFNEKLQWLKLNYRKPEMIKMVDKYAVKAYVSKIIGDEYIIPTLGIWDSFDQISFDDLPDKFVLKTTHDSGSIVICSDKNTFNFVEAKNKLTKALKKKYYLIGREWVYKYVQPRIIAEPYLEDNETKELRDYKFFCFNGKAKCFKIDFDRFSMHRANYYDMENGDLLEFGESDYPRDPENKLKMPKNLMQMKVVAEKIAKDYPFLRVDFYEVNGKMYLGELTFFPSSGFGKLTTKESEYLLGSWIRLPS